MNWKSAAGLGALVCVVATAAPAQEAREGARVFRGSCAGCHGAEAMGNGPTAALLTISVPDLTQIAARNDGVFDRVHIVRLIDGSAGLGAHGGPMPMFGGLLTGPSVVLDGPGGAPVSTTEPIHEIVLWLETIQQAATSE